MDTDQQLSQVVELLEELRNHHQELFTKTELDTMEKVISIFCVVLITPQASRKLEAKLAGDYE